MNLNQSYLNNYERKCGWKIFIKRHDNLVTPLILQKRNENNLLFRIHLKLNRRKEGEMDSSKEMDHAYSTF